MSADIASHSRTAPRILITLVTVWVVLIAVGIWGWAKYGAAVFLEMIVSGIASCF